MYVHLLHRIYSISIPNPLAAPRQNNVLSCSRPGQRSRESRELYLLPRRDPCGGPGVQEVMHMSSKSTVWEYHRARSHHRLHRISIALNITSSSPRRHRKAPTDRDMVLTLVEHLAKQYHDNAEQGNYLKPGIPEKGQYRQRMMCPQ